MDATLTLGGCARLITRRLQAADIPPDEARLDAELLMRATLGWDRARWLVAAPEPAPAQLPATLEPLILRRIGREPMAYLLGRCEFWGLKFEVGPAALVPRPESEILVEHALARLAPGRPARVADVGTGSGCLAVSLAVERPLLRVVAIDISAPAIALARRNAARHGVRDRVAFLLASLLGGLQPQSLDLVVSNPPYVPARSRATLPPEVRDHEPPEALFAGEDGLDVIRELVPAAARSLRPGGWLLFEFGHEQDDAVRELLARSGDWEAQLVADLQGIPRTAVAQRR